MGCHATPPAMKVGDRRCDALGLSAIVVVRLRIGDLGATVALTDRHRAFALARARQDVVRQGHDLRGRAVIASQLNDACARMLSVETCPSSPGRAREG